MPTKEEVQKFIYGMFEGHSSVRGETVRQLITPATPCTDFFHKDVDGIDLCIGKPIGREFGILDMGTDYGVSCHSYDNLGEQEARFYEKYPNSELSTEKFTLERFADMMYDLILIKQGQLI